MSYQETRMAFVQDALRAQLQDFMSNRYDGTRQTVVLLPGGMGSQLEITDRKWNTGPTVAKSDTIWMDPGICIGDGNLLKMEPPLQDFGGRIVFPNGPLRFMVDAYNETEAWFRREGFNYVVFGYDWRRGVAEASALLADFVDALRAAIAARPHSTEGERIHLLCHSQGGLVAAHYLATKPGAADALGSVITVGTPFYGTATHIHRYYVGEEPLSGMYGKQEMAQITGTLPGPYILMFLDHALYNQDPDGFRARGLECYPMRSDAGALLDPYAAPAGYFPEWVDAGYLADAVATRNTLVAQSAAARDKLFHVVSLTQSMDVTQVWYKTANPEDAMVAPIKGVKGPGDGTVPGWSATLVGTADANIHRVTTRGPKTGHGDLLECYEVLYVATHIMRQGKKPAAIPPQHVEKGTPPPPPSNFELEPFIANMKKEPAARDPAVTYDREHWEQIMRVARNA